MNKFFRIIIHIISRARSFNNRCLKEFSFGIKGKKILEIGSGGKSEYSVKRFFDESNNFIQSDINKNYGHRVINVANMDYNNEFEIIICMNVLEHVFDFKRAIRNIYQALVSDGILIITVPVFYPWHNEPNDYWRFTEHSLKEMLKEFNQVKIKHHGIRKLPFAYYIEAYK